MPSPIRIVFMGSDTLALPMLDALFTQSAVPLVWAGVFTQPDRAVGRGQVVQPNGIKTWALAKGIPVAQPEKIADDALVAFSPDLVIVMAYGHILRDPVIHFPRLGTVNFHASLLPQLRGASPIQTAVATGAAQTGVSLMRIVRKLDAGPVADTERVCIGATDTALEVEQALAQACVPLVLRNLPALASGALVFHAQDDAKATFCRRLTKLDAQLDFRKPARLVAARINGLNPWPGASVEIAGVPVKIGVALALTGKAVSAVPGTVLGESSEGLEVAASEGVVALRRLQRPGGKMLEARDFLRGFPVAPGTVLASHEEQPLVGVVPFKYAAPAKRE